MTKEDLAAGPELFGQKGSKIGNSIVVARLLHVAIVTLRSGGVEVVWNEPVNELLRLYYRGMGFVDDLVNPQRQNLRLSDLTSLAKAFSFVEAVYEDWGLQLDVPS